MMRIVKGGQHLSVPNESRTGASVMLGPGDVVPEYLTAEELAEIGHGFVEVADSPAPKKDTTRSKKRDRPSGDTGAAREDARPPRVDGETTDDE